MVTFSLVRRVTRGVRDNQFDTITVWSSQDLSKEWLCSVKGTYVTVNGIKVLVEEIAYNIQPKNKCVKSGEILVLVVKTDNTAPW